MKKALLPLLLILYLHTNANIVRIGNGTGKISKISMQGLRHGDTLAITAGTYTGGEFGNLHDITIINYGGLVTFTGSWNIGGQWSGGTFFYNVVFSGSGSSEFYGFVFRGIAGNVIDCNLPTNARPGMYGLRFERMRFINTGVCFNLYGNRVVYDGTDATFKLRNSSFRYIKCDTTEQLVNAAAFPNQGLLDSIDIHHCIVNQCQTDGVVVAGSLFRFNIHDNVFRFNGNQPGSTDIGNFFLLGNGQLHNNYMYGGRGYITRLIVASLGPTITETYIYNNIQLATSIYGGVDIRGNSSNYNGSPYVTNGNVHIINNTIGNKSAANQYTNAILVLYPMAGHVELKNNLAFNTYQSQPNDDHIIMNFSGGNQPLVSNNRYYDSLQILGTVLADTNLFCELASESSLIGAGIYFPNIHTDFKDSARPNPPSIGAQDIGNLKKMPAKRNLKKAVSFKNLMVIFGTASLAMLIFLYYKKSKKKSSH
ncbi:MAG: hypothetical protein JST58_01305 [Bacteroidetes bacterium]|nr:hypothetical protein [Bacteroidota bacterium]